MLSALQRLAENHSFALYLETLDDVVFETAGSAVDLLQLKHHCKRSANLTDASTDLWKSLRVWIEGRSNGDIPADARLFLITTSDVGAGSAASWLMARERDESDGEELKVFRRELGRIGHGRGARYPKGLKERVVGYGRRQHEAGQTWEAIGDGLGMRGGAACPR